MKPQIDMATKEGLLNKISTKAYQITIISLFVMILVAVLCLFYNSTAGYKSIFKTRIEKIEILEKNYKNFKDLTGEELLTMWIAEFYDSKYQIGGASQYDAIDCATALYQFFNYKLGANLVMENTDGMKKRITFEDSRNYKRKRYSECKIGDLIFFKRIGTYGHVCLIVGFTKNGIRYVDMNGLDGGMGVNVIGWGDPRIEFITEIPFSFFSGDILGG